MTTENFTIRPPKRGVWFWDWFVKKPATNLIFVYGTLKRGYGNNRLLNGATFLGEATTDDKFVLLHRGFPVLMRSDGPDAHRVSGEIFQVTDDATWASLDRLEGVPQMYTRETIALHLHKTCVTAQVYIGNPQWAHVDQRLCPLKNGMYYWERDWK